MPLTAVAIATNFSSSTSSWAPSAPSSAAAWARCASVVFGRRVPDGHAAAEPGRRVGHAADHLVVAEQAGQGRGRRAGEDAQDELAAAEARPDLAPDLGQHLGLDAEEDDVRALDGLGVVGDRPDAVLALEMLAPLRARMAGDDLARLDQLAAEQPGDHRLGHDAGADRRDRGLGEGGHRPEYSGQAVAVPSTKKRPVVVTSAVANPASRRRGRQLVRRVVDLDDRELAAVGQAAQRHVVRRGRVVGRRRLRVRQRIDEREPAARLEPAPDEREERRQSLARDVAQPEAGEHRVDRAVRLGPGVAHVEVRAQPVRHETVARLLERRRRRVVDRELALARRAAATTTRSRPRARRSRRRWAGRPAIDRPCRARCSRPRRGRRRARSGRGGGTSRRTRRPAPRSTGSGPPRGRMAAARRSGGAATDVAPLPGGRGHRRPMSRTLPAPRSVMAWRSRNRRNPLSPALPRQ